MKRWVSVLLATAMLALVTTTGVFAMAKSYIAPFNSYAAPVAYPNPLATLVSTISPATNATSPVEISFSPTLQFSYASWKQVDTSSKEAQFAYTVVAQELSRYTAKELAGFGLKKVYLVNRLYVDGTFRSGMPEAQFEDALYFDISTSYFASESGDYMRRTIHHELRHLADYNLYGDFRPQDNAWTTCNVKDAVYGHGGASMYSDPLYAHKQHPAQGFITGYATSGIDEDRAEVFAYYMTNRTYLYEQARDDASLSCKIAQTEQLLGSL